MDSDVFPLSARGVLAVILRCARLIEKDVAGLRCKLAAFVASKAMTRLGVEKEPILCAAGTPTVNETTAIPVVRQQGTWGRRRCFLKVRHKTILYVFKPLVDSRRRLRMIGFTHDPAFL
jgi:hypothetical protein